MQGMAELLYTDLGRMDYPAALALQERIVGLKQRGLWPTSYFSSNIPTSTLSVAEARASNVLAAGSSGY